MKKLFVILLLFSFAAGVNAQNIPKKIQKRIFEYNSDSSLVVLKKGKKKGLYNIKTSHIVLEMEEQEILLSPYIQQVTVVTDSHFTVYSAKQGELAKLYSDSKMNEDYKNFISIADGYFRINDFEAPLMFTDQGDAMQEMEASFQGSGLYNLDSRVWEIPREYMRVYPFKNQMLAIRFDSLYLDKDYTPIYAYTYHTYKKSNGVYKLQSVTKEFNKDWLVEILQCDSVAPFVDDTYLTFKDGKKGLVYANPFNSAIYNESALRIAEYLPPEYDFIHLDFAKESVFTLVNEPSPLLEFFEADFRFSSPRNLDKMWSNPQIVFSSRLDDFVTSRAAIMLGDTVDFSEVAFGADVRIHSGLEYINDSLVKIIYNDKGLLEPLGSVLDPMWDSIDVAGNIIYSREGFYPHTGIFNYRTNEWLISPNYWNVHFAGDHVVVDEFERGVSILDLNEQVLEDEIENVDLRNNPKKFEQLFPTNRYKEVLKQGEYVEGEYEEYPIFRGFLVSGKMDILSPGATNLSPKVLLSDVDFGVADPHSFARMYLNENRIFFSFNDTTYSVAAEKGEIRFEYSSEVGVGTFRIELVEDGDTTIQIGKVDEVSWDQEFEQIISISSDGNILVANQLIRYHHGIYHPEYMELMGEAIEESENSAVWLKTDSGYVQSTPNYALVQVLPNMYIAETGENSGTPIFNSNIFDFDMDLDGNLIFKEGTEKRYILLDSSLKAISFLDHYDFNSIEDIGFGLKLCTDKGCMFVTYDGQAITDDSWEEFQLAKDGRLLALRKATYDEFDEMRVKDGVATFFNLPKK